MIPALLTTYQHGHSLLLLLLLVFVAVVLVNLQRAVAALGANAKGAPVGHVTQASATVQKKKKKGEQSRVV